MMKVGRIVASCLFPYTIATSGGNQIAIYEYYCPVGNDDRKAQSDFVLLWSFER